MRWLLLLLLSLPAQATLTDEKWAFARANPCPTTKYQRYYNCPGYGDVAFPSCEPWRSSMAWVKDAERAAWDARAKAFCACRARPVEIMACTTRGCRVLAVNCKR